MKSYGPFLISWVAAGHHEIECEAGCAQNQTNEQKRSDRVEAFVVGTVTCIPKTLPSISVTLVVTSPHEYSLGIGSGTWWTNRLPQNLTDSTDYELPYSIWNWHVHSLYSSWCLKNFISQLQSCHFPWVSHYYIYSYCACLRCHTVMVRGDFCVCSADTVTGLHQRCFHWSLAQSLCCVVLSCVVFAVQMVLCLGSFAGV